MKNLKSKVLRLALVFYIIVVFAVGSYAFYNNFQTRWYAHIQDISKTLDSITYQYEELTNDFWRYYLPLISNGETAISAVESYFSVPSTEELTPIERQRLIEAMATLTDYFDQVQWVALSASLRDINYVFFRNSGNNRLEIIQEEFPFYTAASHSGSLMHVHGSRKINGNNYFVVGGGTPYRNINDKMLFGFSTSVFDSIIRHNPGIFDSLGFHIAEDGELIYSSTFDQAVWMPESRNPETVYLDGRRVIVYPAKNSPRRSIVYFTLDYSELFRQTVSEVYRSLALLIVVLIVSVFLLFGINTLLNREISAICYGLKQIGNNHLDYRFSSNFHNDGFNEITLAINSMAEELQHTIERSYQFELKQRENEMAELMAKFDPHFLYNTLELFRARCQLNGDDSTANLIAHAGKLFRGLLSSKNIITVQEELAFCEHYLHLFRGRFGEHTRILYDFEDKVLRCMIIRNVLQPLIENYFEHGFDGSRQDNYLKLSGTVTSESSILLTVQDNGRGISNERLAQLREQLSNPSTPEGSSYGLKNLHQRIRLYYGKGYGLELECNDGSGLRISVLLPIINLPPERVAVVQEIRSSEAIKKTIQHVSDS